MGGRGGDQIKNFYQVNRSQHRVSDRSRKKSQISWDIQRQIRGKNGRFRGNLGDNSSQISPKNDC